MNQEKIRGLAMKQTTIKVNGDTIKVTARASTRQGNLAGFIVKANEQRYFFAVLTYDEAIEKGYVKYIKECR